MKLNDLPSEMLMRVFHWLPMRDLNMVVLVSRRWRSIGEDPSLWEMFRVMVRNIDQVNNLTIRRLQYVREICVLTDQTWQAGWLALFHTVVNHLPRLQSLDLSYNNLSSVEPRLFARTVNSLEEVKISLTYMTNVQAQELFTEMSQNTQLKKLDLSRNNLSSVDPTVLATGVSRLEYVDLRYTKLSIAQLTCILTHVQEDTKLKKLFLRENRIDIEPGVIRNARERLGNGLALSCAIT